MAAQKGREMLIKIDVSGTPTSIGGMRTSSISFNETTVDVTTFDSTSAWRELLAGAGIKSMGVTGSGVFKDTTAENTLRTAAFAGTIGSWDLVVPGLGTFTGTFHIDSLEYGAAHDGEVTFTMTLSSSGAVTFA